MNENSFSSNITSKMKEITMLQEQLKDEIMNCVKTRKDKMTELQNSTEEIGNRMIRDTTMKVLHRIELIMNTLESILYRCEIVENKFNDSKNKNFHSQQINHLNVQFNEIKHELQTYYNLIEKVTNIFINANQVNNNSIKTINDKISKLAANQSHIPLQEQIQSFYSTFENNPKVNVYSSNNQFNNYVTQEFKSIQNAIISTSNLRQEADDSIANAMKEFTDTLQNALKIVVNNTKY